MDRRHPDAMRKVRRSRLNEDPQSRHDELCAPNSDLREQAEWPRATADVLDGILNSLDSATLVLDRALRVLFATRATKALFNAIDTEIGLPVGDLTHRLIDDTMEVDARAVLSSHDTMRREVKANDGAWYIRSILPYRTDAERVHGVVVTFTAIAEIMASIDRALARASDDGGSETMRETAVSAVSSLTVRQRQIMALVMAGQPSKNIAADLGISQRTVDNHRAAIMRKTGSKSLSALIQTAIAAA